jgi:hypothetical protein
MALTPFAMRGEDAEGRDAARGAEANNPKQENAT